MHTKKSKRNYRLIYTLGEHHYLGFIIEPHAVLLNANGELSFTHKRLFSNTADDYADFLDDTDRRIINLLDEIEQSNIIKRYYKKSIRPADYFSTIFSKEIYEFIRPKIEKRLLEVLEMLGDKDLYMMGKDGYPADQRLTIANQAASVLFHFRRNEIETRYFPTIKYEGKRIEFMFKNAQIIVNKQAWMLLDHVLYYFDQALEGKKLSPFLQKRYISVSRATEHKYFEMFVCGLIERHHVYAEGFDIKTYQHDAIPVLKLIQTDQDNLFIQLYFQYGPYLLSSESDQKVSVRMEYREEDDHYVFHRIRRPLLWESQKKEKLQELGLKQQADLLQGWVVDATDANLLQTMDWFQKNQELLQQNGFELQQDHQEKMYFFGTPSLTFEVKEGNDWFDIHAVARFGAFEIPFLELSEFILSGQRTFKLPNGELAIIPEEWLARFPQFFHFAIKDGRLKLKKHHLGLLEEVSDHNEVMMDRKLQKLGSFEEIQDVSVPKGLRGTLRNYQKAGFNWMCFLQAYKFGGCLADDMGLGKTIQTLALLQREKESEAQNKRVSMIIMPTSLIYNWEQEAKKFTPDLKILVHTGMGRMKTVDDFVEYDVVITTYGIARIDEQLLQSFYFHYLILDESQHIKNPSSKSFKVIKEFKSTYRLVLSGTPIENSVTDLWSQMTFLNPGLLGSFRYFKQEFALPIEKKKDEDKANRLQAIIKPFVLRRTKEQVAKELPPKFEQIVYCDMDEEQQEYYERVKSEHRNELLAEITSTNEYPEGKPNLKAKQIALLKGLTKLRQLANHPSMIDEDYTGSSGKFEHVLLQLESVLQRGNKVLIFSQFVKQLNLFKVYFDKHKIKYTYLDGATNNRAEVVERFRTDEEIRTFLISIKAGGVGLNLTEADYVFVLDPWWNPAVEQQAIDRTHRIGQQKNVFIYKFISRGTVEEKILSLQQKKTKIAKSLITTEESFFKSLTAADIQALLD